MLTFSQLFSLCCGLNLQTKSNLTIVLDFNAGAIVILDLTPYSDLGFGKTINETVSQHSVNNWLDLTTFRKTGPREITHS